MKRILILILALLTTAATAGCALATTVPTATTATTSAATNPASTDTTTATTAPTTATTTTTTTTSATTTTPTTTATVPSSSTTTATRYQTIELFSMNDVHGGAYYTSSSSSSDPDAFAKAAELLAYKKQSGDNAIILATGDMFQGTALSNYYYGLPLVEVMNYAGFDAFTIGNHEFDWGIDKIANYADGNPDNGEADFRFLAANIVSKTTGEPMPWTVPYIVVDVEGVRVGVIGVIGDVINSISASRVADYEFRDAAATVADYAAVLRTEEDCQVVVASIHEYDSSTNASIAALTGTQRVDAVFNGHSHTNVAGTIARTGTDLPYAQVSSYPYSLIAKITLVYDRTLGEVTQAVPEVISATGLIASAEASAILDVFAEDLDYLAFVNQVLANAASYYGSSALAPWGASVVRDYAGVDFGMVNAGGFRTSMDQGTVTMGDLVTIYPFDNLIKTCEMTGAQISAFYVSVMQHGYDVVFDDAVGYVYGSGLVTKDGIPVDPDAWYTVAAVDYIFDKTYYDFLDGKNITTTDFMMRNLLAEDLAAHGVAFDPADGTAWIAPVAWIPAFRRDESIVA